MRAYGQLIEADPELDDAPPGEPALSLVLEDHLENEAQASYLA